MGMDIAIRFLGGFREQGRSCIAIEYRGKVYVLDAGIKKVYARYYGEPPYLDMIDVDRIECIVVSHLHEDHLVMVPYLVRKGFSGAIYMSKPTYELGRKNLVKWAKIFEEDGRKLYSMEDVDRTWKLVKTVGIGNEICEGDACFRFYRAGHAVGALSIEIEIGGRRILYLADVDRGSRVVKDLDVPTNKSYDLVVINASYGASTLDRYAQEKLFIDTICRYLDNGFSILVPLTAVGRGQETLSILWSYREILGDATLFVHRSIMEGFETLSKYPEFVKEEIAELKKSIESWSNVHSFSDAEEIVDDVRRGGKIVLAPDLMLMTGASRKIFETLKDWDRLLVILTGYQAPGTIGRSLLELGKHGVARIGQELVSIRCRVAEVPLKMHFDLSENVALVKQLNVWGEPRIVLHHGEEPKTLELAHYLSKLITPERIWIPNVPSTYYL